MQKVTATDLTSTQDVLEIALRADLERSSGNDLVVLFDADRDNEESVDLRDVNVDFTVEP